jgi:chemotaxis protein MotB
MLESAPPPDGMRQRRATHQSKRGSGAWKVAYADFVTALMALFIVLWMMNSSKQVKASVSGYFHDPRGYTNALNSGMAKPGDELVMGRGSAEAIQERIEQALRQMPEFRKIRENVKFGVSNEGLRVDLIETEQGLFFVAGSPTPTSAGERLLATLAAQLRGMPNLVAIEGHTDARPFRGASPQSGYGNWDLAADRANAARRLLHAGGVPPEQVAEVRGLADRKLLLPAEPNDPRNRRVSVVVLFLAAPDS